MRTQALVALVICAVTGVGFNQKTASGQVPAGWIARGSQPKEYEMGGDRGVAHGGKASGTMKFKGDKPAGFGTLMQTFKADAYRGKRLRLSGYVKTEHVEQWTGLWMRVDGEQSSLAFDNMENRPIKGSTDWQKYEVVLDVPADSMEIAFGILLAGKGQAWVDDLQLDHRSQVKALACLSSPIFEATAPRIGVPRKHLAESDRQRQPSGLLFDRLTTNRYVGHFGCEKGRFRALTNRENP